MTLSLYLHIMTFVIRKLKSTALANLERNLMNCKDSYSSKIFNSYIRRGQEYKLVTIILIDDICGTFGF
jgi:hypothetical protein